MATCYEFTIIGKYQNQQVVNRLTHVTDIDDPTVVSAFTYAQALGIDPLDDTEPAAGSVIARMLLCQSNTYTVEQLFFRNLHSVIDFYEYIPGVGTQYTGQQSWAADGAMSFIAQKFKTNRVRLDIRPGTLSLTPPNEESTDAEGVISGTHLNLMNDLVTALNAPPSYTLGAVTVNYRPAILKKQLYTVPNSNPPRTAYRYFEDKDEQLQNAAIGVTWSAVKVVTTQTSRRVGKGR